MALASRAHNGLVADASELTRALDAVLLLERLLGLGLQLRPSARKARRVAVRPQRARPIQLEVSSRPGLLLFVVEWVEGYVRR